MRGMMPEPSGADSGDDGQVAGNGCVPGSVTNREHCS
ncbi:hypothetical protein COSO111634_02835 [Corallococcus soli]